MPKKSSKKKSTQVAEGPVVEEDKKSYTSPQKSGDEIDEIFAGKKRKKPDNGDKSNKAAGDVDTLKLDDKVKKSKKKKKKDDKKSGGDQENGNNFKDRPSRPRKRTGDGLAIYTEDELGIGKADAGGTPLCPFDCDCCF